MQNLLMDAQPKADKINFIKSVSIENKLSVLNSKNQERNMYRYSVS